MRQTQLCADVIRTQCKGALKGVDGLIGERCRRKSAGEQIVGVDIARFHIDGAPETINRRFESILVLKGPSVVDDGADKIRRVGYGLAQVTFRVNEPRCLKRKNAHHAQGIDVGRVGSQDFVIQSFCFIQSTCFVVFGGMRHFLAFRVQVERFFECLVCLFTLAEHGQRFAQVKMSPFQLRVEACGSL